MENNQNFLTRFQNDKFPLILVALLWLVLLFAAVKWFGCPVRDALLLMGLGGGASLIGVVRELVTTGSVDKEYTHLAYSVIILITFVVTVGLFRDESALGDAPLKEADVQKVYGGFERTSILNEPVQIDSIWKSCDACARDERAFAKAIFATDSARLIAYLREQSVQDSVVSKMSEKQRNQLQQDLLRQHRTATTNEAARIFDDIAFRQNLTDAINEYLQDYDPQLLTRLCEDFSITEDTYLVDETFKDTPVAPPDGKALTFLKGAFLFKKTMKKILVTKAKKRSSDGVLSELTIIRYQ